MLSQQIELLIGQMFIFGFQGHIVDLEFVDWYSQYPVGGVILYNRNLKNATQIKRLTADLKMISKSIHLDIPFIVAVDQECGALSPLRGLVTSLPGNMGLAATGDSTAAFFAGYTTGTELNNLGINLNLAPMLDLAFELNPVIGTRSFSDKPEVASEFGLEFARGLMAGGVLFTAKHFPGHGSCFEDSHLELPVCLMKPKMLLERDSVPFQNVMKLNAASLMMAHVKYPCWDPKYPASLSPRIINILRRDLRFTGVIITDCLEMKAVQNVAPYPEDAVQAIEAGNDLLLIGHTPAHQHASFDAVRDAVKSGRIKISRIEESVERIIKWKKLLYNLKGTPSQQLCWTPEVLAEKVITLFDPGKIWRFNREPLSIIAPELKRLTPAENPYDPGILGRELNRFLDCHWLNCSENPSEEEINQVVAKQRSLSNQKVVFLLSNPIHSPGQIILINRLVRWNEVLLVCIRNPREVLTVGADLPALFTYSTEPLVLQALARVLAGEKEPQGEIPITWYEDKNWRENRANI